MIKCPLETSIVNQHTLIQKILKMIRMAVQKRTKDNPYLMDLMVQKKGKKTMRSFQEGMTCIIKPEAWGC